MDITVLVQGGAVGIAILAISVLSYFIRAWLQQVDRMVDVVKINAEAMTGLKASIDASIKSSENMQKLVAERLLEDFRRLKRQKGDQE